MSHVATNWAFQQRGISPVEFRLLAILADHHNPDFGCFPEQDTLADRCEISRATVNRQLDSLEQKGLIRREQRRDARTNRQKSTRYMLAFEDGFVRLAAESRVSNCDTENGEQTQELAVDNGEGRVSETPVSVSHSSDTLTGNEPVTPLVPKASTLFDGLVHIWPSDKHGDLDRCRSAMDELTEAERETAHRLAKEVLIKLVKLKRGTPRLHRYLEDRIFAEFDGAPDIDKDGSYVITPKREEWSAWLGDIRSKWGQPGVDRTVKLGFYLPPTRWPEGHPNAKVA